MCFPCRALCSLEGLPTDAIRLGISINALPKVRVFRGNLLRNLPDTPGTTLIVNPLLGGGVCY